MGYFYKKKFKIFFIYIVNLQILELFVRSLLKIVYPACNDFFYTFIYVVRACVIQCVCIYPIVTFMF